MLKGEATGEPGARPVDATPLAERSLAPDLARGVMLLLIALANVSLYLYGEGTFGYGLWVHGAPALDQVLVLVQTTLVNGRAYPMFALLFGYGIVQLQRRQTGSGRHRVAVRKLVRRRGCWLVLFGFLHALLLFSGDIIGAYGLLAILLAGVLLRAGDRQLMIMVAVGMLLVMVLPGVEDLLTFLGGRANATTDPLAAAGIRVRDWVRHSLIGSVFLLASPVLLGAWAARRRLLDEPQRHRRFLRWVAVLGVGLAAVGGLPWALHQASWWQPSSAAATAAAWAAHVLTGYPGGVGYAAIAGLAAVRVRQRGGPGAVVTALAACGQRSMTCYLLQSVVFVAVLAAYGGGLGDRFGLVEIAVLAVATWVLTVLLAEFLRRRGYRGPAEVLLRRLTYRSRLQHATARTRSGPGPGRDARDRDTRADG